jgi:bromodomain-containing protein 8
MGVLSCQWSRATADPRHSNAMMYNAKGSQVYDMAEEMLRESENHIAHFRTLQHDVGR